MKRIRLWRPELSDKAAAHELIKHQLELPDYYGKNLDALWDMLTEIGRDIEVVFDGPANDYSQVIEDLFLEAARHNSHLSVQANQLRLVSGAEILTMQSHMAHRLYRRMLKSDVAISVWLGDSLKGWLIAQQASEALIIEACRAEEADYILPLLEQLKRDYPDERLIFLDDAPAELAGYIGRQMNVTVYERIKKAFLV